MLYEEKIDRIVRKFRSNIKAILAFVYDL
jgi:hypothetical protein